MTTNWHITRIKPGASRVVRQFVTDDGQLEDQTLAERGFDCYFPRMRKDVRNRRTRQIITRRFPLFAGYAFVGLPSGNADFYRLTTCPAVSYVLGVDGEPWCVPAAEVERLRHAEANLAFDDTREARIRRREEGRTRRETIAMQFPEGLPVHVHDGPFAGFHGHVTTVTGRGHVKAMINLFGRLTPCQFEATDLEAA